MLYEIEQIVEERNRSLYADVSANVTINFDDVAADIGWGARYNPSTREADVRRCICSNPAAAFAHELLHVKFELNGYLQPEQIFRFEPSSGYRHYANSFRSNAYNHLMHRKMYPEFISLGYGAQDFYHTPTAIRDLNAALISCKDDLEEKGTARERRMIASDQFIAAFFMSTAPGIEPSMETRFRKSLSRLDHRAYDQLELHFNSWLNSESPDIRWYLARLFYMCGSHDVGVGYTGSEPIWASSADTQI